MKTERPLYFTRMNARFCDIILAGDENGLARLHLDTGQGPRRFKIADAWIEHHDFFADTIRQIEAYFNGSLREFNVPTNPRGTGFQKTVWKELGRIGYGALCTYKDIARAMGKENGARAVGMANSRNPIPLIIPCHRVIRTDGALAGFAHGVAIKKRLIDWERSNARGAPADPESRF